MENYNLVNNFLGLTVCSAGKLKRKNYAWVRSVQKTTHRKGHKTVDSMEQGRQ